MLFPKKSLERKFSSGWVKLPVKHCIKGCENTNNLKVACIRTQWAWLTHDKKEIRRVAGKGKQVQAWHALTFLHLVEVAAAAKYLCWNHKSLLRCSCSSPLVSEASCLPSALHGSMVSATFEGIHILEI